MVDTNRRAGHLVLRQSLSHFQCENGAIRRPLRLVYRMRAGVANVRYYKLSENVDMHLCTSCPPNAQKMPATTMRTAVIKPARHSVVLSVALAKKAKPL